MTGRAATVVVSALVGCYSPNAATNVPCASNGDCPGSQLCNLDLPQPVCVDTLPDAGGIGDDSGTGGRAIGDPCTRDRDCASTVCGETQNKCLDDGIAVFVSPTGSDASTCTRMAPCQTLSVAASRLDDDHTVIRVGAGSYADALMFTTDRTVLLSGEQTDFAGTDILFSNTPGVRDQVILGQGANISIEGIALRGGKASTIQVQGGSLSLHHVLVTESSTSGIDITGASAEIIDSQVRAATSLGIDAHDGGMLAIHRSIITGDPGGGVRVAQTPFDISSSWFVGNGSTGSLASFAMQNAAGLTPQRFSYNTVADNAAGGVSCMTAMTISSSVFSDNNGPVTASCVTRYSLFRFSNVAGKNNIMADPLFVAQNNGNYHIQAGSPAIDVADPDDHEATDIDGEMRPSGGGNDLGADELH